MNAPHKKNGFALTEVVSILVITSLIGVYAAESVMKNIETYSFYSRRHLTQSDARHAINRIALDLRNLDSTDITNITANSINFTDDTGTPTNFRLDVINGNLTILRDTKIIMDQVDEFTIKYYDATGVELAAAVSNIPQVRRIGIEIKTPAANEEGQLSFKTVVVPRSFVGYADYLQN